MSRKSVSRRGRQAPPGPPEPPPGYVDLATAVRLSGVPLTSLRRRFYTGVVPGIRLGHRIYLYRPALERLRKEPRAAPDIPLIPLRSLVGRLPDADLRRIAVRWAGTEFVPLHELVRLLGVLTPPPWPFDWGPSGPPSRVEPVTANGEGLLVGPPWSPRRVGRGDWLLVRCFGDRPALVLQAPPPGEAVVVLPGESGEGPGVSVEGPDGLSVRLRPDLVVSVPREAVVGGLGVAPPEVLRAVGW